MSHYYPGTIMTLFGVAYLIWAIFEPHPILKRNRVIRGCISLAIGVVLFFMFRNPI